MINKLLDDHKFQVFGLAQLFLSKNAVQHFWLCPFGAPIPSYSYLFRKVSQPTGATPVSGNYKLCQANYKLCRVKRVTRGPKGVPYAVTHDGRTLRYPDPDIKAGRESPWRLGSSFTRCFW